MNTSPTESTDKFRCFYECHKCKKKHEGTEYTPDSVVMVRGGKPNEWVFECVPLSGKSDSSSV